MKYFIPLALAFCFLSLVACQQEEGPAPAPQPSGIVTASQAYLDNFGEPPQGKAGEAFARVGYLPVHNAPDKVRAFPFFLFSKDGELRQILNRLTGGDLVFPENSTLYSPFPSDLMVTSASAEKGTQTLSLMTQQSWSEDDMASAGLSLAATVLQFEQTNKVVIMLNGRPLPQMPADGYVRDPGTLIAVEPPSLVLMAGMWEKGTDNLDELLVEFDRPIKVNSFKLYNSSEGSIEGEYFTSIFQMAVVVLPGDKTLYKEGDVLRAEWDVVDIMGRANSGSSTMPLRRYEH
jgi:hypothetical protein